MIKKDNVSQHMKPSRIKKANASVRQVLDVLREMTNPFEMTGVSSLFNIATENSVMSEKKITLKYRYYLRKRKKLVHR